MTNERITAPKVMARLESHQQYHDNKIDGKLHDVHFAVFGERGKGGLCSQLERVESRVEELEKTNQKIDKLTWAVITAIVIQLVMAGLQSV